MAALSQQKFDISDLPHGLPGREQLRQFAASMLPQSERNGMELCFLTIALNARVRVLKVAACAARRGSAAEAQRLYSEAAMPFADGAMPQKEDASGAGTC